MIALVAAMGRNRVIGKDGTMPWHLPAELKHFRRVTRGKVVVMGRKTYESIGEPLKGRTNIVLTRDLDFEAPGCEVAHSVEALLHDERPLYVIGGAQLYRQFLPHADLMHLTRIDADFEGDTFFPEFVLAEWRLVAAEPHPQDEKNLYSFTIETYERIRT
ncbi:MAG: dihydrofolate reductase [Bacillota bacterium]